jgi:hypothetical protein
MEVSGQLHILTTLSQLEELPIATGLIPEQVCSLQGRKSILPLSAIEPQVLNILARNLVTTPSQLSRLLILTDSEFLITCNRISYFSMFIGVTETAYGMWLNIAAVRFSCCCFSARKGKLKRVEFRSGFGENLKIKIICRKV